MKEVQSQDVGSHWLPTVNDVSEKTTFVGFLGTGLHRGGRIGHLYSFKIYNKRTWVHNDIPTLASEACLH